MDIPAEVALEDSHKCLPFHCTFGVAEHHMVRPGQAGLGLHTYLVAGDSPGLEPSHVHQGSSLAEAYCAGWGEHLAVQHVGEEAELNQQVVLPP